VKNRLIDDPDRLLISPGSALVASGADGEKSNQINSLQMGIEELKL